LLKEEKPTPAPIPSKARPPVAFPKGRGERPLLRVRGKSRIMKIEELRKGEITSLRSVTVGCDIEKM